MDQQVKGRAKVGRGSNDPVPEAQRVALPFSVDQEEGDFIQHLVQGGERARVAFTELYHRYQILVLAVCECLLEDRSRAEEVTQEALFMV